MRYEKFVIENFKGIRKTTVKLDPFGSARVYSLVGLNESGKTSLLEAIHSFSPDADTEIVVGSASSIGEQRWQRVPKDKVSDFTGDVIVTAHLCLETDELAEIEAYCKQKGFSIDCSAQPTGFSYSRIQRYENGTFVGSFRNSNFPNKVKSGKQKKFRKPDWDTEQSILWNHIETLFPTIAYFPTFLFDFPSKIYLSDKAISKKNAFYWRVFQDILDFDSRGHSIDTHIIGRIGKDEYRVEFPYFLPVYQKSNDREIIQQVIDHAARSVTNVIFEKWNDIFGEDVSNKEVVIEFELKEAPKIKKEDGTEEINFNHDLTVEFFVKDGINRFPIKTRSLGFRWFFSFLLFTQFRAARNDGHPVLFLLDEPASNLHADAQQKLIESFPEIARGAHTLIYSTHSHYMIDPNWLEQCYVITNDGDDSEPGSLLADATRKDDAYNIQAIPYKTFVGSNPKKFSYFQPIIDRLNIVPSRFDINKTGVILEGKSDYYILVYLCSVHWKKKLNLLPGLGAGTLDALIAIHKGWGLAVRVMLDSDDAGKKEQNRYHENFLLDVKSVTTIGNLVPEITEIEDLLTQGDRKSILKCYPEKQRLSKADIFRHFQIHLASKKKIKLSAEFNRKAKSLINALEKFVQ